MMSEYSEQLFLDVLQLWGHATVPALHECDV